MFIVKDKMIILCMTCDKYAMIHRTRDIPIEFQFELVEDVYSEYDQLLQECKKLNISFEALLKMIDRIDICDDRYDTDAFRHAYSSSSHMKVVGIHYFSQTKPRLLHNGKLKSDTKHIHLTVYAWPDEFTYLNGGCIMTRDKLQDVSEDVIQKYYGVKELSEPLPGTIYFE